jgi:tetratricopeptide (TPR) repeat protein
MKAITFFFFAFLLQTPSLSAQFNKENDLLTISKSSLFCNSTKVVFDISSVESIYLHPKEILNNIDSFWVNDKAYSLTKQYHTNNNIKIPFEKWENRIKEIARLTSTEAKNQLAFITSNKIIEEETKFIEKAIPHICSFLPKSAPPIKVTAYFTSEIEPGAFALTNGIVMNVASPRFNNDPDVIMNIIVHEVYHSGYAATIFYRTEFELENETVDFINNFLLNEGLATYVSYKAQDIFPNKYVPDYKMLESEQESKRQIDNVNFLLSKSGTISQDSLKTISWEIGVKQRAYYVAGAFMAKTIDENLGRDSLINILLVGPRKLIHTYNSLVNNDKKIVEFELPGKISSYQYLRKALANNDYQEFNKLKAELIKNKVNVDPSLESKLNGYGYGIINSDITIALELFNLNATLFPNSADAFDSLGEAFMKDGNKKLAIENYEKSLELNPQNSNALEQLKKLKE